MFNDLYLDREKIGEAIEKFGEIVCREFKYECKDLGGTRNRWFINSEEESFYIDMYYKKR